MKTTDALPEDSIESPKIRRSSRIQTLETRRGGQRRREVVFSGPTPSETLSKSLQNLNDDESNSSTSSSVPLGLTSSISTPNISTGLVSPLREPTVDPTSKASLSPASMLKLKTRWMASDADEASAVSSVASRISVDVDINSLSLSEDQKSLTEPQIKITLLRKPGWISYDPADVDLTQKLSKFQGIDENIFKSAQRTISKDSRGWQCDCFLSKEEIARGEVGCSENCLNRLLMVECGNQCPTGNRCTNKKFQRKEYCRLEVFKTEQKGHGLRTQQTLPSGEFVIEYVGEVLDPREFNRRTKDYAKDNLEHFYFMALKSDAIIDATQRGNCSRFINHSCEPNCETQKWTVNGELRIGFFALRDLAPGEEITFNYQFQRYGKEAQRCYCQAGSCRGWIGGDDNEEQGGEEVEEEDEENEPEETGAMTVRPKAKRRPYVRKRKKTDVEALKDLAFEEELSILENSGLRNKNHTLTLSRLMVRAEKWDARERLLNILIRGDTPCRRLFLDYHGLRLIWGWMLSLPIPTPDAENSTITDDYYHKLLLQTLLSLPIPHKTMLQDSKVLTVVEKWAQAPDLSTKFVPVTLTDLQSEVIDIKQPHSTQELVEDSKSMPMKIKDEAMPMEIKEEHDTIPIEVKEDIIPTEIKLDTVPMEVQQDGLLMEKQETKEIMPMEIKQDITTEEISPPVEKVQPESNQETTPVETKEKFVTEEIHWAFVNGAKDLLSSWSDLQEVFRIPKKERVEQMKKHEREADKRREKTEKDRVLVSESSYDRDRGKFRNRIDRRLSVQNEYHRPRDGFYSRHSSRNNLNTLLSEADPNLSKQEKRNLFAAKVAKEEAEEKNRRMSDEMLAIHQNRCAQLFLDSSTTPIVDPNCRYYLDPVSVTWKEINLEDPNTPSGIHLIVQASQCPPGMILYAEPVPPPIEITETPPDEELFPPWPLGLPPPPPLPPTSLPKYWKMHVDDEGRCYYYDGRTRQSQWIPPSPESSEVNSDSEVEESDEEVEGEDVKNADEQEIEDHQQALQKFQSWMTERAEKRKRSGLVSERIISPRSEEEKSLFISSKSIRENKLQQLERKGQEFVEPENIDPNGHDEVGVSISELGENNLSLPSDVWMEVEEKPGAELISTPQSQSVPPVQKQQRRDKSRVSSPGGHEKTSSFESSSSFQVLSDKEDLNLTESLDSVKEEKVSIPGLEETTPSSGDALESPSTAAMLTIVNSPVVISNANLNDEKSAKRRIHKKSKHGDRKLQPKPSSSTKESREKEKMNNDRKTKEKSMENFRSQIANIIVQHLNPYRKHDCEGGRITTTEDFKYLARKMTHSITLKELKHCKDGKTLIVNESVKHKTKEFVRKYMARYQSKPYARSPEEPS